MRCSAEARASHSRAADWHLAEAATGQAYLGTLAGDELQYSLGLQG